ncbi:14194_t:CDS:2 [Funneliformis mosseae]|uniref:14194_t:CDS:1 n=1 Tax=Funneliformis mosseae TaxID=27381 RepID=A0A9N9A350_FUNMO|nr:14194_t:CDS:2 [Funneliformis mosseae]
MVDTPVIIPVQDHVVHGDGVKSLEIINTRYYMVAMSPNAKYIVGYGLDNECFVGWNIQDINEGKLELDDTVKPYRYDLKNRSIFNLSVSDEKIVAFTLYKNSELDLMIELTILSYHFNTKNELILLGYKNDNAEGMELISIKNDKIWLRNGNCIKESNYITCKNKNIRIFKDRNEVKTEDIRISSNDKFTCLKINDEIIVYSDEIEKPFALLDTNYGIQLYTFMKQHTDLQYLLLSLIGNMSNNKTWVYCLNHITKDPLLKNNKTWNSFLNQLMNNSLKYLPLLFFQNHLFVIVDDYVLKIKIDLELDINSLEELQMYEDAENWMAYFGIEKAKNNNNPFITNMEIDNQLYKSLFKFNDKTLVLQDIKVDIHKYRKIIGLRVYKRANKDDYWHLTVEYVQMIKGQVNIDIFEAERVNNDIGILTSIGIFIFNMSENDEISLKHFHYILLEETIFQKYNALIDYKELIMGWISYINNDKLDFLKYGHVLLRFAIKVHDIKLISNIYKTCFYNFKQDLENNKTFLSIITTTMPLFKESYPDYLIRYSLDTNMIIDSMDYNVRQHLPLYLHPCTIKENIYRQRETFIGIIIYKLIYVFDNNILGRVFSMLYLAMYHRELKPAITFIIPYFKFVSYPQKYSWWKEFIKPQPSPFVETISRDIYKTMNGEALIIFKWNSYGKLYYAIIWTGFMALLGCFTVAATISEDLIFQDIRKNLLLASMILGFIHLTFEIRQFIYNPFKWIRDFWNIFGSTDPNPFIIQAPDENTNLFSDYGTSLFAIYLFLAAEIELFYLLPYQRRRESWFPDVIYYHADVDVVRRRVNELIKDNEWGSVELPEMNKKLLDQIKIQR